MTKPVSPQTQFRPRRVLIVVGMHRSGTSATTGALQCLGVKLGSKLYAGHQGVNPKGYFEHSEVADTNDEALLALGSGWDDILLKPDGWWQAPVLQSHSQQLRRILLRDTADGALLAIKDPRICRLLPWWMEVLASANIEPMFLFALRSPTEVFRSLERRDGFSDSKSYLLWCLHYLEAELWSRRFPRAVLEFGTFLASPADELQRVEDTLGVAFPRSVAEARDELAAFVSTDLRHHLDRAGTDPLPLETLARQVHACLAAATVPATPRIDQTRLDALRRELCQQINAFPPMLVEQLRTLGRLRGDSQLTVNRLMRSWSWYVGKPVRFFERALGRVV
jgi:hypothetical protein